MAAVKVVSGLRVEGYESVVTSVCVCCLMHLKAMGDKDEFTAFSYVCVCVCEWGIGGKLFG